MGLFHLIKEVKKLYTASLLVVLSFYTWLLPAGSDYK